MQSPRHQSTPRRSVSSGIKLSRIGRSSWRSYRSSPATIIELSTLAKLPPFSKPHPALLSLTLFHLTPTISLSFLNDRSLNDDASYFSELSFGRIESPRNRFHREHSGDQVSEISGFVRRTFGLSIVLDTMQSNLERERVAFRIYEAQRRARGGKSHCKRQWSLFLFRFMIPKFVSKRKIQWPR